MQKVFSGLSLSLTANAEHIFASAGNVAGEVDSVMLPEKPATLPKLASALAWKTGLTQPSALTEEVPAVATIAAVKMLRGANFMLFQRIQDV